MKLKVLSYFDPLTGEVIRRVPRLTIYPKSHYVTRRDTVVKAIDQIKVRSKSSVRRITCIE